MIRTVIDSRPPAQSWLPLLTPLPSARHSAQPSLLDDEPSPAERPRPTGIQYRLDTGPGSLAPAKGLPEPAQWTGVLALAIAQVLSGIRPAGQLERWLDDPLLADVRCVLHSRQRLRRPLGRGGDHGAPARVPAVTVVSVRAQCPNPHAVEAAAHLRLGAQSVPMALRLQASGDRWLCTHLELGPWPGAASDLSEPRPARGTS